MPAYEGKAFLSRFCGGSYCRTVILSNRIYITAAVGVKADSVLINLPCCLIDGVRSRHGGRNSRFPSNKSMAFLCYYGSGYCGAELCGSRTGAAFAAVGIKGKIVAVEVPLRNDSQIIRRESIGNLGVPTEEGEAFFYWVGGCCYGITDITRNRVNFVAAGGIKGDCALCHRFGSKQVIGIL